MPEILIIDDDQNLSTLLREFLNGQGYATRYAANGRAGLREMFERKPDLIILDVTMPQMDGWETLKRIREMSDIPVIMLTARDDESDILRGFSIGADDYVTKPFSFAQLAARIKAVLARKGDPPGSEHLTAGDLTVDIPSRRVVRGSQTINLTPTEFNLLVALMRRKGEVLSSEELARQVWGPQYASEVGFVRRYIWHLRQKMEQNPDDPQYIHNERGYGYRFQIKE
ncbi:MAG: response regulator transcription factor [Anaerolineales bacterium]|nr:response regulator transcription factor [Anaerolineales bacterium]